MTGWNWLLHFVEVMKQNLYKWRRRAAPRILRDLYLVFQDLLCNYEAIFIKSSALLCVLCAVCLVYGALGRSCVFSCAVCLLYKVLVSVLCCVVCLLYSWEVMFFAFSVSCRCNTRLVGCSFLLSCIRNLSRRENQTLLALSGCSARWRQKMGRAGAKSWKAFCRSL